MIHDLCREIGYWAGLAAEDYYDRELSDERETYRQLCERVPVADLRAFYVEQAQQRMAWLERETAYQRRVA